MIRTTLNLIRKIDMSDKVVVIGFSGSGKTTFMKWFIKNSRFLPMYIVDPLGNFSEKPDWKKFEYSGVMPCKPEIKGHTCIKMTNEVQLEAFVEKISKTKPSWFLIVDEIDRFIGTDTMMYYTERYLEEGRNYNRGGMFSVRRLGFLNKSILSNAHYLVMFKINNKNDKDYLNEMVDFDLKQLTFTNKHSFYVLDLQTSENLGEMILPPETVRGLR